MPLPARFHGQNSRYQRLWFTDGIVQDCTLLSRGEMKYLGIMINLCKTESSDAG